jgi:hypothetical protein
MNRNVLIVGGVIMGVLVIAFLSVVSSGYNALPPRKVVRAANRLVRSAAQSILSAEQQTNPLSALKHVLSAKAYLGASRDLMGDTQLMSYVKCNVRQRLADADTLERSVYKDIKKQCSNLVAS